VSGPSSVQGPAKGVIEAVQKPGPDHAKSRRAEPVVPSYIVEAVQKPGPDHAKSKRAEPVVPSYIIYW
jgi:hypothetical protein